MILVESGFQDNIENFTSVDKENGLILSPIPPSNISFNFPETAAIENGF